MANLLVAGCSVSDYTQVDKVWGEYLAEDLGLNYIHEGAGCGSNWRMWRVIVDAVKTKQITPNDIVILQYTESTRREFWSSSYNTIQPNDIVKQKSNDLYGDQDGNIIRYKIDSHQWQNHSGDRAFFKIYNRHVNEKFEQEMFLQQHSMFQCFMKQYGFDNVYFVNVGGYGNCIFDKHHNEYIEPFYKDNFYHAKSAFDHPYHLLGDPGHLSDAGHRNLSKSIATHFKFGINT